MHELTLIVNSLRLIRIVGSLHLRRHALIRIVTLVRLVRGGRHAILHVRLRHLALVAVVYLLLLADQRLALWGAIEAVLILSVHHDCIINYEC